jgi:hypothetical protein
MNIYKVLPDLSKQRQMQIWHKALRAQWSASDLNWERPRRVTNPKLLDELARVLTPVLMGEQSALYSVSGLIPILGHRSEVESQFYLTTWAVDEARHTELFARFYGRIDREPMPIRRFPTGYLFQSRIVSKEPAEWLSGVLVSEVLALRVMHEFKRLDLDPVLSDICDGILQDESRHLGFNHIYLEERFSQLYGTGHKDGDAFAAHLRSHLRDVLDGVPPIFEALSDELANLGIDRDALFAVLSEESSRRLEKSIDAGYRVANEEAEASKLNDAAQIGS